MIRPSSQHPKIASSAKGLEYRERYGYYIDTIEEVHIHLTLNKFTDIHNNILTSHNIDHGDWRVFTLQKNSLWPGQ